MTETDYSPITLPKDKRFEDLNIAHGKGEAAEEKIYSKEAQETDEAYHLTLQFLKNPETTDDQARRKVKEIVNDYQESTPRSLKLLEAVYGRALSGSEEAAKLLLNEFSDSITVDNPKGKTALKYFPLIATNSQVDPDVRANYINELTRHITNEKINLSITSILADLLRLPKEKMTSADSKILERTKNSASREACRLLTVNKLEVHQEELISAALDCITKGDKDLCSQITEALKNPMRTTDPGQLIVATRLPEIVRSQKLPGNNRAALLAVHLEYSPASIPSGIYSLMTDLISTLPADREGEIVRSSVISKSLKIVGSLKYEGTLTPDQTSLTNSLIDSALKGDEKDEWLETITNELYRIAISEAKSSGQLASKLRRLIAETAKGNTKNEILQKKNKVEILDLLDKLS